MRHRGAFLGEGQEFPQLFPSLSCTAILMKMCSQQQMQMTCSGDPGKAAPSPLWSTSLSWRFMGWGLSSIQVLRGGEGLLLHPQPRPSRCFLQSSIHEVPPVHPTFLTLPQCCSCGAFILPGIVAPGRARTPCGWLVKQCPRKLQANKAWLTFRPKEPPLLCSKSLLFLSLCRWRDYFQANGALLGTLERWQVHHD